MKHLLKFALAFGVCICAAAACGQNEPKPGSMAADLAGLKSYFEENSPDVGSQIPDITVFTSTGEELGFRELMQEQYSVVVLGCLT